MSAVTVTLDRAVEVNWACRRGDGYSPLIVVKNSLGQVIDVSGYHSVKMQLRRDKAKGAVIEEFDQTSGFTIDAAGILWGFSLDTAGSYFYDLEVIANEGDDPKTIMFGKINVTQDTTR